MPPIKCAPCRVRIDGAVYRVESNGQVFRLHDYGTGQLVQEDNPLLETEARDVRREAARLRGLTVTQADKESLAIKILAVHGPGFIQPIKELRARLECPLFEAKDLIDIARGLVPSKVTGAVHTSAIQKEEEGTKVVVDWNAKSAERWLRRYALHLSREARYIRENAAGFAENEDEFRCGLANGLGIDDVKEQDEIVVEVHKTVDRSADRPADKPCRNRNARERNAAMRDLGMRRTPYGWE